jgi:hypothetical protein
VRERNSKGGCWKMTDTFPLHLSFSYIHGLENGIISLFGVLLLLSHYLSYRQHILSCNQCTRFDRTIKGSFFLSIFFFCSFYLFFWSSVNDIRTFDKPQALCRWHGRMNWLISQINM